MAQRKPWSKVVVHQGVRVRLFDCDGTIYRDVTPGRVLSANGKARTQHDIKSLEHGDRKLAEQQAKQLAAVLATQRLTGHVGGKLTLAQLRDVYLLECGALLTDYRKGEIRKAFRLFARHLGDSFDVADLGPHQVQPYEASRKAGTLASTDGGRHVRRQVRARTIAKELGCLHAALNCASTFRRNGRPLIPGNPLRGVPIPSEPNRRVAHRRKLRLIKSARRDRHASDYRCFWLEDEKESSSRRSEACRWTKPKTGSPSDLRLAGGMWRSCPRPMSPRSAPDVCADDHAFVRMT